MEQALLDLDDAFSALPPAPKGVEEKESAEEEEDDVTAEELRETAEEEERTAAGKAMSKGETL